MKFVKGFFNILKWVIISLTLTLVINSCWQRHNGAIQPMFMGWGAAVVQTGSMEPNVPVGTLIVIHEQDTYEKGDVVTYIDYRDWSITHRVEFIKDGIVSTRGDANQVSDPLFDEEAIVGKMVFMIPHVGKVLDFIKQPVVIAILVILLFVCIVWDIVAKKRAKKRGRYLPDNEKPSIADKQAVKHEQKQLRLQEKERLKQQKEEERKAAKQAKAEKNKLPEPVPEKKPVFNTTVKKYVPKNTEQRSV